MRFSVACQVKQVVELRLLYCDICRVCLYLENKIRLKNKNPAWLKEPRGSQQLLPSGFLPAHTQAHSF